MRGRPRREIKHRRKKDIIKVKIPENCFKCIWRAELTFERAKIKCTKKDAEVVKEDESWMCCSYSDKKMMEEKTVE